MFEKFLFYLNNILWGKILLPILLLFGLYLFIKSRFYPIRKIKFIYNNTVGTLFKKNNKKNGVSPFEAVCTALGGTIGVGNTIGVASAILYGGAGTVFWMWISSILGMLIKYSEIYLSMHFRKENEYNGSTMLYIEKGLKSKTLASIFSILCILTSLGMGNISQANAICISINEIFTTPSCYFGIFFSVLILLITLNGTEKIINLSSKMIPIISILYIIFCLIIIFSDFHSTLTSFKMIFENAFKPKSMQGGILGIIFSKTVVTGFSKGMFSNEAGLGSAPIIHGKSLEKDPEKQSVWGIFEVFLDTIVICTISALVMLKMPNLTEITNTKTLTLEAFGNYMGRFGEITVSWFIIFFALASILSWNLYGQYAISYLSGSKAKKALKIYSVLFSFTVFFGFLLNSELIWQISDLFNGLMALLNILCVIYLSKLVKTS